MLVSFILPACESKFLNQAIESFLNQRNQNFELFLFNFLIIY